MKVVEKKISIREIKEMAKRMFGILVKAVIDIERNNGNRRRTAC